MLLLQWFHSLQKIVFFLLEWPYKESLKLISQGTQLLYIWDQASEQKNQAFMAKRNKNIFLQPCMPPRPDLFNGLSFIYQGPPKSEKHITLCGHPITKSFNCTLHASKQILRILAEGISRDLFTRQIMVRWCICPTNAIRAPDLWHLDLALRSLLSWLRPPEAGGRA